MLPCAVVSFWKYLIYVLDYLQPAEETAAASEDGVVPRRDGGGQCRREPPELQQLQILTSSS